MNEQERAEEHLKTIRRLMERATIYRAISAPTALVGGVLSLVASGFYLKWRTLHPGGWGDIWGPRSLFLKLWLAVLLITAGANTLFIVIGARKRNEPVFSASMKTALTALAPAFIVGAAFTICRIGTGRGPGTEASMSVVWAICYGVGLLATSHFAPRSLTILGWAFLLSSIAGLMFLHFGTFVLFGAINDPAALFMALTFGLFHLIYAACAWPRKGAPSEL